MAPRSIWKGYLRLSLVNCAVALYPAVTEANKIHFHQEAGLISDYLTAGAAASSMLAQVT